MSDHASAPSTPEDCGPEISALDAAVRLGSRAARVGFDWPTASGARAKVAEELDELDRAVTEESVARQEEELGDLLFAIASLARKLDLDPDRALRGSLARFQVRFAAVEGLASGRGQPLDTLDAEALDALWCEVKRVESSR